MVAWRSSECESWSGRFVPFARGPPDQPAHSTRTRSRPPAGTATVRWRTAPDHYQSVSAAIVPVASEAGPRHDRPGRRPRTCCCCCYCWGANCCAARGRSR
uniref:(northern house mosquito) hypothetical protein n=1 Tax=Culex pipiens TaxID=7175 RepID=A0A8D8FF00_CULPI